MSIDVLQERIRKTKCPVMLELAASVSELPAHILAESSSPAAGYARACRELLDALKGTVPAVRVSFSSFALLGPEGMTQLTAVLQYAKKLGYYITLDAPEILGVRSAQRAAAAVLGNDTLFPCDSLILLSYMGTDCV